MRGLGEIFTTILVRVLVVYARCCLLHGRSGRVDMERTCQDPDYGNQQLNVRHLSRAQAARR